ncbi:hypothetical protein [Bradyrhizobium valentinum]|uniref:hypothetical protein n=1 Tax=Bradyrhizobium valentinum TaxID=1518501 RepID=UPI0012E3F7A5|nr:hypothetical protein [Bradyrhizobium valentinum]
MSNAGDNPFFVQQMHDRFMKNQDRISYAAYSPVVPKAVQPLICDASLFSAN